MVKLLFDAGIFIHAEIAVPATQSKTLKWGTREITVPISGAERKPPQDDPSRQNEFDALFTVGRLIREGRVQAFRHHEVMVELWRGRNTPWVSALTKCDIFTCEPALHRSKFRSTTNFREAVRKGGKKDREKGIAPSNQTQLAFLSWLHGLKPRAVEMLILHATEIGLTSFEVESLQRINWFQIMCGRSGSAENYVDVFHLWTAERNGLCFLTLDNKIKRLVERVAAEKSCPVSNLPDVFLPTDLLRAMGVTSPDPVPFQTGAFFQPDLKDYEP